MNRNNDLSKARLLHCNDCEHRLFFVCKKCGCHLSAKSRIEEEECPEGRWPNYYRWFNDMLQRKSK